MQQYINTCSTCCTHRKHIDSMLIQTPPRCMCQTSHLRESYHPQPNHEQTSSNVFHPMKHILCISSCRRSNNSLQHICICGIMSADIQPNENIDSTFICFVRLFQYPIHLVLFSLSYLIFFLFIFHSFCIRFAHIIQHSTRA